MTIRSFWAAAGLIAAIGSTPAGATEFYLFSGSPSGAQILTVNGATTISAFQTGWFDSNGTHYDAWTNYFTGVLSDSTEYRSFFSFRPSAAVTSASVTIGNALDSGYGNDSGGLLALTLYDVSSSIVGLRQYNGATAIFDDLGTGTVFGRILISAASGSYTIDLNQAGVDAINAAYYGAAPFTIGARLTAVPSGVPEPAAWALMIGGVGLAGGVVRARRRKAAAVA